VTAEKIGDQPVMLHVRKLASALVDFVFGVIFLGPSLVSDTFHVAQNHSIAAGLKKRKRF